MIFQNNTNVLGSHGDLVSAGIVTTSTTTSPPTTSMNPTQGLVFSSRILPLELVSETDCPENMKSCCYDQDIDLDTFNVMCKPPDDPLALDQQVMDIVFLKVFFDTCPYFTRLPMINGYNFVT